MSEHRTAEELNALTRSIIGAAINIHRLHGPGLLESTYASCLVHDLFRAGLRYEAQKPIPLVYGSLNVPCAYRADLIVEGCVVVEVKALDVVTEIHKRQLRTYLQLTDCRVGLGLNFGAALMKDGIYRAVHRFPGGPQAAAPLTE